MHALILHLVYDEIQTNDIPKKDTTLHFVFIYIQHPNFC